MGISLHHAALFSTGPTGNLGNVIDILAQVSGTADILPIDGTISPPLDSISAAGESQIEGRTGDGVVFQRIDYVRAIGSSDAVVGDIQPGLEQVSGYALGSSVCFGSVGGKPDSIFGFGSVINCFGVGRVIPKIDSFHGEASTQQTAFGHVNPKKDTFAGFATTYLVGSVNGRISGRLPAIQGSTLAASFGRVNPGKDRVSGSAYSSFSCSGNIRPQLERVSGKVLSNFSNGVLDFDRDGVVAPSIPSADPSSLHYSRDTVSTGTSPAGSFNSLSFTRQ